MDINNLLNHKDKFNLFNHFTDDEIKNNIGNIIPNTYYLENSDLELIVNMDSYITHKDDIHNILKFCDFYQLDDQYFNKLIFKIQVLILVHNININVNHVINEKINSNSCVKNKKIECIGWNEVELYFNSGDHHYACEYVYNHESIYFLDEHINVSCFVWGFMLADKLQIKDELIFDESFADYEPRNENDEYCLEDIVKLVSNIFMNKYIQGYLVARKLNLRWNYDDIKSVFDGFNSKV
jgi:hypothetical protein